MEIKGELKRNGLPSLFRNFATENFHGVLTITSSVGHEKLISITENEVTIYCDELNEASRLGNILMARGQVTEEVLEHTLRDQRKLEPRPKLGDMLVQRKIVKEEAISDARRFQIEEDICDILSWKKARFHFAGADSAREIHPEDFAPDQVHRLTIDPDTFFKYVAKTTEDWDSIGDRLPTQYLCFKVSAKANDSQNKLTADGTRVLRYLKEGRTVEGAVKQSCLGRIQVCVQVIELLEKGLVLPASGADLRFMASEHRAQKRYHDALYIYRRLLESPDAKDEVAYLENLIEEISEQILRLKLRGEYGEEAIIVSHRDAKEKYYKSQFRRNLAYWVAGAAAFVLICYLILQYTRPPAELPQQYKDVIARANTQCDAGEFKSAMIELDNFYKTLPDKEDHWAVNIQEKKAAIPDLIRTYVRKKLNGYTQQGRRGGDDRDKALVGLRSLLDEYPQDSSALEIKNIIDEFDQANVAQMPHPLKTDPENTVPDRPGTSPKELADRLNNAEEAKKQKKYSEARRELLAIRADAPANGETWKKADGQVKSIQDIEDRANDLVTSAVKAKADNLGDQAIEMLGRAIVEFGDLGGFQRAEQLKTNLEQRKSDAKVLFVSAKEAEDAESVFDARMKYEQVAAIYPEFPVAGDARKKADALKAKCDALRKQLDAALDDIKAGNHKAAQKIYRSLFESNSRLLSEQKAPIPVYITSSPSGAEIKLNEAAMGTTPRFVIIAAGEAFKVEITRPGFCPKIIRSDRLTANFLDIMARLELDPVVIDFPEYPPVKPPRPSAPLLAPPIWFGNWLLVLSGPDLHALQPPGKDSQWNMRGLYDPRLAPPESAPIGEKSSYWNFRSSPSPYKPGFLLLPARNRELIELDLSNPVQPKKRNVFARLAVPPPEVVGRIYIEEHSKLAGKSLMAVALVDGTVHCFIDFGKDDKDFKERWSLPLDPQDTARHEAPAAGLFAYNSQIWVLSAGGLLQAIDPDEGNVKFSRKFDNMSPRSMFSEKPGDPLACFVQLNGKVTLYDLENRRDVWSLPPRQAMEESVGVLIDESAIFVTAKKNEYGELFKYPRIANMTGGEPLALASAKLDGFVTLDMAQGKYLYLITNLNKVFAYSKGDLKMLWEFAIKPELGAPRSIRVFGDYVYIATDKGKLIVLKAE